MSATSSVPASGPVPATVPIPGRHTEVEKYDLSFKVLSHIDNGQNEERTLERHRVRVDFGGGREATFDTEANKLDTALEAMEMLGREIEDWDKAQFDKYINEMEGKWIWFNITSLNRDPNSPVKRDQVTARKADRHGGDLEYAFPQGKGFKAGPILVIEDHFIKQLHRLAKLLRERLDESAANAKREAEKDDFTISLEQIN